MPPLSTGISTRRRVGLSAADQAMSTVSNVIFVAFAAHALPARAFGALSLGYVLLASAQLIARAAIGEVLLVKAESAGARDAVAAALTLGFGIALGLLAVAGTIGGVLAESAWALCPFLPLLFLQDTLRYLALAEGRPGRALESDTLWVAGQIGLSAAVLATGTTSMAWIAFTWTMSGTIATAVVYLRRPVRLRFGAAAWFRAQRGIAPYYIAEAVAVNGSAQLFTVGVALIAGLEATGALRAATVLFGPMNTLVMAAGVALVPELVRRRHRGERGLRPAVLITAALVTVTAGWGAALLLGRGALAAVFGDTWGLAATVAPYFFLRLLFGSASTGPLLWLRATGAGNATTSSRVATSAITVVAGVAGTLLWGVRGAAAGLVLAQAFNAVALWRRALRIGRRQPAAPTQRAPAVAAVEVRL